MSKRLYDERLETMSEEDVQYIDEMDRARRSTLPIITKIERLRRFRSVMKEYQRFADPDFKRLYDLRLMQIDRMLDGLEFALKLDVMQCPL